MANTLPVLQDHSKETRNPRLPQIGGDMDGPLELDSIEYLGEYNPDYQIINESPVSSGSLLFNNERTEAQPDQGLEREITVPKEAQAALFDGLNVAKEKAVETGTKILQTAGETTKDFLNAGGGLLKEIVVTPKNEAPKNPEDAKKGLENRQVQLPPQEIARMPLHEVNAFKVGDTAISKAQLDEVLGIRTNNEHINPDGTLRAYTETEAEKGLKARSEQQEKAADREKTLSMAIRRDSSGDVNLSAEQGTASRYTAAG